MILELMAITDNSWQRHVNSFKPVEIFAIDDYLFELYVIDEIGYPINYLYRLLCFKEGIEQPVVSINTEFGPAYIYFHSATVGAKQINLGMSAQTETLEQFRAWALERLPELLLEIDQSKLTYIQEKGLQLAEWQHVSEFEYKRMQKNMSQLVELSNEFMYPIHSDEPMDLYETTTIPILNVKLLMMISKQGRTIGAILFPKKEFDREKISKWLYCYGIYFERYKGEPVYVHQCSNVLFSYLADGYVMVVYLKGKERKQVKHIYDTARHNETSVDDLWHELDEHTEKSIYVDDTKIMADETIELMGELNVVYVNGITMYADRVVIKDGSVSLMKRDHNCVIAQIELFSDMQIEVSEIELDVEKDMAIQYCTIEYERIM